MYRMIFGRKTPAVDTLYLSGLIPRGPKDDTVPNIPDTALFTPIWHGMPGTEMTLIGHRLRRT